MGEAAAGQEREDVKLIVQALGNHVEKWVSELVILDKGSTHHVSNTAEKAKRSERQAVRWPTGRRRLYVNCRHTQRGFSSPGWCEWPSSEITRVMLLLGEQGSMCSDQDSQLVSDAIAAETDTEWQNEWVDLRGSMFLAVVRGSIELRARRPGWADGLR